jgi:hypothetical protein
MTPTTSEKRCMPSSNESPPHCELDVDLKASSAGATKSRWKRTNDEPYALIRAASAVKCAGNSFNQAYYGCRLTILISFRRINIKRPPTQPDLCGNGPFLDRYSDCVSRQSVVSNGGIRPV